MFFFSFCHKVSVSQTCILEAFLVEIIGDSLGSGMHIRHSSVQPSIRYVHWRHRGIILRFLHVSQIWDTIWRFRPRPNNRWMDKVKCDFSSVGHFLNSTYNLALICDFKDHDEKSETVQPLKTRQVRILLRHLDHRGWILKYIVLEVDRVPCNAFCRCWSLYIGLELPSGHCNFTLTRLTGSHLLYMISLCDFSSPHEVVTVRPSCWISSWYTVIFFSFQLSDDVALCAQNLIYRSRPTLPLLHTQAQPDRV